MNIGIINVGTGNLTSVKNAIRFVDGDCEIFSDSKKSSGFDALILPGVGAYGEVGERLRQTGFFDEIKEHCLVRQRPMLGICLGMQLLLTSSVEHGSHEGLNLVPGEVLSFKDTISGLPIPHTGWSEVHLEADGTLIKQEEEPQHYYFVHSYFCKLTNQEDSIGTANYGIRFDAALEKDNIFGFQFHPEKSQKFGLSIIKRFVSL